MKQGTPYPKVGISGHLASYNIFSQNNRIVFTDYMYVAVGSMLPDLIDKTIGMVPLQIPLPTFVVAVGAVLGAGGGLWVANLGGK
ncbi:hypothetical protein Mpsy_0518 [Methanolobus psychrophilus R15]|nr:hypothetical protein Mpsy_0518 [Methanolobus psychrophilus R15]